VKVKNQGIGMWQAADREGALDKKVESRVVSAGRHGISVDFAKGIAIFECVLEVNNSG